ncbi:MAG: hypothetical protein ACI8ZN_000153 [Bacteroidia bacterium]|jgi:hypothetical protein
MNFRARFVLFMHAVFVSTCVQAQDKEVADYRFDVQYGQASKKSPKYATLGLSKDLFNVFDNKLRLGMGIRIGLYHNVESNYTTADKGLKKLDSQIDTLFFSNAQAASINFNIKVEYYLIPKVAVGVQFDILGISEGFEQKSTYLPGKDSRDAGFVRVDNVKNRPTKSNAFSTTNAKGSLLNQVFIRFEPTRKFSIMAGISILTQEISSKGQYGSNSQYRFERLDNMLFVGLSFGRFDEK